MSPDPFCSVIAKTIASIYFMYYLHKNQWFLTWDKTKGRSESKISSSGLERMTHTDVLQLISSRFIHTILQFLKPYKEIRNSWSNHQKSIIEVSKFFTGIWAMHNHLQHSLLFEIDANDTCPFLYTQFHEESNIYNDYVAYNGRCQIAMKQWWKPEWAT